MDKNFYDDLIKKTDGMNEEEGQEVKVQVAKPKVTRRPFIKT